MFVHADVYEEFVAEFVTATESMEVYTHLKNVVVDVDIDEPQ